MHMKYPDNSNHLKHEVCKDRTVLRAREIPAIKNEVGAVQRLDRIDITRKPSRGDVVWTNFSKAAHACNSSKDVKVLLGVNLVKSSWQSQKLI